MLLVKGAGISIKKGEILQVRFYNFAFNKERLNAELTYLQGISFIN